MQMILVRVCLSLLCFLSFTTLGYSQTVFDFANIYENITSGYRKQVIPISEQSKPLQLNFQTYLMSIYTLDEQREILTVTMVISLQWIDPRLTWEPSLYGNTTRVIITTDDIWLPYVYLVNSADDLERLGHDADSYAYVTSTGFVYWNPGGVMKAKCRTDISKFPFDVQTCEFQLGMWGVSKVDVNTTLVSNKSLLTYFIPTSDWELISYKQYILKVEMSRTFVLELSIKRRPLYNIVTVILPTMLFALMNPMVFILPVESGERVSFGMTILLAYAIFLTLVASSVPVSSNPICVLLVLMVFIMIISGVIVIWVIISINYYYRQDTNGVSSCMKRLLLYYHRNDKANYVKDGLCITSENFRFSGKDVSRTLDAIFITISYVTLIGMISGFYVFVFVR
jgi:hypothetical protein